MADLSVQMALVGTIQPEVSLKAQMNAAITAQSDIYDDIAIETMIKISDMTRYHGLIKVVDVAY